jgi:hypothetical protein
VIFSSNIIKSPKSSGEEHRKKRKKEVENEKLQESLQIKGKSIFLEEKNTLT